MRWPICSASTHCRPSRPTGGAAIPTPGCSRSRRTADFGKDDWVRIKADGDVLLTALVEMYQADERFARYYDDVEPGLARFLHDIVVESLNS